MKLLPINRIGPFFGLLLLLLLTYFRENILLEINANIASETYSVSYYYWFSDFFKKVSPELLVSWKWGVTVVFSLIMSFITILSLYSWFNSIQVLKIISFFYLGIFAFICLSALIGYLGNSFNDIYFILRKTLGVVQSPIPFFSFFALFYSLFKR